MMGDHYLDNGFNVLMAFGQYADRTCQPLNKNPLKHRAKTVQSSLSGAQLDVGVVRDQSTRGSQTKCA